LVVNTILQRVENLAGRNGETFVAVR